MAGGAPQNVNPPAVLPRRLRWRGLGIHRWDLSGNWKPFAGQGGKRLLNKTRAAVGRNAFGLRHILNPQMETWCGMGQNLRNPKESEGRATSGFMRP